MAWVTTVGLARLRELVLALILVEQLGIQLKESWYTSHPRNPQEVGLKKDVLEGFLDPTSGAHPPSGPWADGSMLTRVHGRGAE